MTREKKRFAQRRTSRPFTVVRGPVPRMPRATVVRDRLIPKRVRGDNLLALQVRKDLHVYST